MSICSNRSLGSLKFERKVEIFSPMNWIYNFKPLASISLDSKWYHCIQLNKDAPFHKRKSVSYLDSERELVETLGPWCVMLTLLKVRKRCSKTKSVVVASRKNTILTSFIKRLMREWSYFYSIYWIYFQGLVYTKRQRKRRVNAAMMLAILVSLKTMETKRDLPEWGWNQFLGDSIVFNESCIAIVIAVSTLRWRWRLCLRWRWRWV